MTQKFYQKEAVQASMIGAIGVIIVALITVHYQRSTPKDDNETSKRDVTIEVKSVLHADKGRFYAGELLWITLKGTQTDRVYWLFDQGDTAQYSDIQIQHVFKLDDKRPKHAEKYHRVDAFFRDDTDYRTAHVLVPTINLKVQASVRIQPDGFDVVTPEQVESKYKLTRISLAKFRDGTFRETSEDGLFRLVPISGQVTSTITFAAASVALGYAPGPDAKKRLLADKDAYISITYRLIDNATAKYTGEPLTILRNLGDEEPK